MFKSHLQMLQCVRQKELEIWDVICIGEATDLTLYYSCFCHSPHSSKLPNSIVAELVCCGLGMRIKFAFIASLARHA
jgi:hypothetical protein